MPAFMAVCRCHSGACGPRAGQHAAVRRCATGDAQAQPAGALPLLGRGVGSPVALCPLIPKECVLRQRSDRCSRLRGEHYGSGRSHMGEVMQVWRWCMCSSLLCCLLHG